MCFLAVLAIWTKTREIKLTQSLPDMLFRAVRTEGAETFFVVWTWRKFLGGVYM